MKTTSRYWYDIVLTVILGMLFLFTGCVSNWALSPRDRSIKKWEASHQNSQKTTKDSARKDSTLRQFRYSQPKQ